MHRALFLSEILLEIFAHMNEIQSPLTEVARTCKSFYEPAMNFLWADIHGIEPLLNCVTRLHPLMKVYGRGSWTSMYFSSEGVDPLSEHEARQFLRHAARVRSLRISSNDHFHLLTVLPLDTCMFPRLLKFSCTQRQSFTHLQPFWSPTLRHCILPFIHSDLKSIATRCPVLENLEFMTSARHTADELSLLSETICACKRLKHLVCPALDSAAWNHLSNLPTLVALRNYGPYSVPLDRDHLNFTPFLNVTFLDFEVEMVADIITVMQHSEFPSLKEFRLHTIFLHWEKAEDLFCALLQCKACQTLERVEILSWNAEVAQDLSCNSSTVIRQFLCFRQLRFLQLCLDSSIYLDNNLLSEAMSSWPHIQALHLVDVRSDRSCITFRGLFAALRLCPHLHTLQVLVDAVNIDIDPNTESFQHTSLQELCLGSSPLEDSEVVARIIFSVLPCVSQVTNHLNRYRLAWDEVNTHLESLAVLGVVSQEQEPKQPDFSSYAGTFLGCRVL